MSAAGSEFLLRGSIWLALAAGMSALCLGKVHAQARAWRVGAIGYLAHVVSAFEFRHAWSHAAAWAATAEQTAAVTGWNTGAGLWVNYTFTLAWALAAILWVRLPLWVRWSWIAWFLFMTVNGAVIFVNGATRLLGIGLLVVFGITAFVQSRRDLKGC